MRYLLAAALLAILGIETGGGIVAFRYAEKHNRPRPSYVTSDEFKVLADVIDGSIRITNYAVSVVTAERLNDVAILISDENSNVATGSNYISIGHCAGASAVGSHLILLGDYVAAPYKSDNFVNIANKLCFWRDTGNRVACPPPESECEK